MMGYGGDQGNGGWSSGDRAVRERTWVEIMQSMLNLCRALKTMIFEIFSLKSLPMAKMKVTHTQVNKHHLAEFCNLAPNTAIELYLKADTAVLYSFQRGVSGHLK